jgi:hypothetical protein
MAIDVVANEPIRAAVATKEPSITASDDSGLRGQEPVIVDLGKKSRKQVRKLRKGKPGRLLRRVEDTIEQLRSSGEFDDSVRPVIIVVREKSRRSKRGRRTAKLWGLG